MSNLSDLLPAGAGGKQVDFVASGTIGNGVTVALNTDGTVTAIASDGTPEAIGSASQFESGATEYTGGCFDPVNNKVVFVYRDSGNSGYGKAVVGTISGTSISFGTPVTFNSGAVNICRAAYHSSSGQIIVSYIDQSSLNYVAAILGTVSGTTISFGSESFAAQITGYDPDVTYDASVDRIVLVYSDGDNGLTGRGIVGDVSGTSITWYSIMQYESGNTTYNNVVYDPVNKVVVVAYRDESASNRGTVAVGDVIGGASNFVSWSSPVQFTTSQASYLSATYAGNGKIVIVYRDQNNSDYGTAIVGTVSGTSISFGTPVVFESSSVVYTSVTYDSNADKVTTVFRGQSNYGRVAVGAISGSSISFSTPSTYYSASATWNWAVYDSYNKKVAIAYSDNALGYDRGKGLVFQNESSNYESFIGISDAAISDTASGSVTIKGGISSNVTGLTPNSTYYVQSDGSLSTTASSVLAGKALSSTSINLDYTS